MMVKCPINAFILQQALRLREGLILQHDGCVWGLAVACFTSDLGRYWRL